MSVGDINISSLRRRLAAAVLVLAAAICVGFLRPCESSATDQILELTAAKDHYFLGPYLYYLEDPQKNLTIDDVSSPQTGAKFVRHTGKLLNLGLNSYAYWIRFTVVGADTSKKWLLFFGWPNAIDEATLYKPKMDSPGWIVEEVGRVLPTGPDPMPSRPADFLPDGRSAQPLTIYLRIESTEVKQIVLQILTAESFQRRSKLRLLGFGVYYGIMLAMLLYNLILFISLREFNRLCYLLYLLSLGLVYFVINGLWWEFFIPGIRLNRALLLIFLCFAFFWGNFFARSFLNTPRQTPFFDKLLSVLMAYSVILAAMVPLIDRHWITLAVISQSIVIPPVFLLAGFAAWKAGFRPARFFLIAFAILALSVIFEALVTFGLLPYTTSYSSQIASALEVILLQLALADRIKTLSQEKERITHSLSLAREVQQSLLPHRSPKIDGLDIAGKSIYCEETGGDYYDYICTGKAQNQKISVAVGDVSGHGISSALLMATVRSSLRQRSSLPGSVASVIADVNRQLVADVEDSGQFMTMFYISIDPANMQAQWVRAGHDPAVFYDPRSDTFEELGGSGIALGVDEDWRYEAYVKESLAKGQIILLSTDGIWEAFNPKGEMFGKERVNAVIRKHPALNAQTIIDKLFEALNRFQKGAPLGDDITLVVIKIT